MLQTTVDILKLILAHITLALRMLSEEAFYNDTEKVSLMKFKQTSY